MNEPDEAMSPPKFVTGSGRPVDRVYGSGAVDPARIGQPGQPPFTRGIRPAMYRQRLWTMRQYAGYASAAESNRRYRYLLEQGSTGLSVAFDLPTQIGYDSDEPLAAGEVGRVGVPIDSLDDMEALFEGIDPSRVSTSMTINATAPVLLAMYAAVAEAHGADLASLRGTVQNDILKEYIARGTQAFPPGPSLRLVADVIAWCVRRAPQWNPISISGYHMREAGATAGQEVAFTLASAIAYTQSVLARGLAVDDFAPRLSFFFAVHTDLFEEAAKFRAARRLYARIMADRFGARDPRSLMLRFHAQTGGVTLTAQQPDNNVARVTLQALAAVLGGAQSLHANARDEALGLPTEASATLALRTQQIIAHESGVTNTVDPLGGSYFVETLTDELESEAQRIIARIDELGGMVAAIEAGWPQAQIEQSAYAQGQAVQSGERVIVGVNRFADDNAVGASGGEPFSVPDCTVRQVELLKQVRARRDAPAADAARLRVERAARGSENLMPAIIDAVKARVTLGEICGGLRQVFGSALTA